MTIQKNYIYWIILNFNLVIKKFLLKLNKIFFRRYSFNNYPNNLKKKVKNYLSNNKIEDHNFFFKSGNLILKKYKDTEYLEKFYRFESSDFKKNKNKKLFINLWYKKFYATLKKKNSSEFKLIWEGYNISYRIINLIEFSEKNKIKEFNNFVRLESQILLSRLEYFQKGINNHILKNAQALIYAGIFLGDKSLEKIGFEIMINSLKILISKNGLLRESSTTYHFLICNLLFETSEFVIKKKHKTREELNKILCKILIASIFFKIQNKFVIFGDTTPDKKIEELKKNIFNFKLKFPRTSNLIQKKNLNLFNSKNCIDDFYKIKNKNLLIFFKFNKEGILNHLNHQHEDNFHFNLYYKNSPVFTQLNRLNYVTAEGTLSKYHNSVTVNNFGPLINNSKKYMSEFVSSKNKLAVIENKFINMKSDCFKFVSPDFKWIRNIALNKNKFYLDDVFISKKKTSKKVYLHIDPSNKFLKKENNRILFINRKLNFRIEICFEKKNINFKLQKSIYSNNYGSKVNTLSLVFENNKDNIFTNKIIIRFID